MTNEELIKLAMDIRKNAFAKLTNYGVGAILLTKSGKIYIGTNIEEYSIPGLSSCAERVAFQNALSHGERQFDKIAIVGGKMDSDKIDETVTPCGVCLQYILDVAPEISIVSYIDGKITEKKVTDFLLAPFELYKK